MLDSNCCSEELSDVVVLDYSIDRILIQSLDDLDQSFIYCVVSHDLPQAIVPYPVECLFEVGKVVL